MTKSTHLPAPSGQQWHIAAHGYEACVVEVGGGLRSLTFDGEPLVYGYPEHAMADAARGHVLAPWPNRIAGGRYSFGGVDFVLPLTEPARGHASHGLVRWMPWQLLERSASALRVGVTLHPQPGWAWTLRVEVTYALDEGGLTVTPRATNLSGDVCPLGFGMHPYLTTGECTLDEVVLTAPVATRIEVDDALIPTRRRPAEPGLRSGITLDGRALDTCFTDITPDDDGRWRVSIAGPTATTTLWADADDFGYVQMFTGDELPEPNDRRSGLAVEPMTCPANAFVTEESLMRLESGASWSAAFGITRGTV